jgi:hypothetical protein
MVILTKPKCLKHTEIPRVVKETKFQSVLKSLIPVRPALHTDQTSWTYSRTSLVHRTCPVPSPDSREFFQTYLVLNQTGPVNNMTIEI